MTSLREQIRRLEEHIQALKLQARENSSGLTECHLLETEIRSSKLALAYYRAARQVEKKTLADMH